MPKRWERDLRRLGEVPAPTERIHARSTRPSDPRQGDGLPATRQRVLAGVVAFGVFIAAGAFLVRAIDPTPPVGPGRRPTPVQLRATLSFAAENPPRGVLSLGGEELTGVRASYDWCDGSGECVEGTGEFATWPPVDRFMTLPAGIPIVLDGPIVAIKAQFVTLEGEKVSEVIEDPAAHINTPDETQLLALVVQLALREGDQHGSGQFFFGVEPGHAGASDDPTDELRPSDTLRLRCGDGGAVVTTPIVVAQEDGVHVIMLPIGPEQAVQFELESGEQFGGPISADGEPHPWPIAPGPAEVSCHGTSWRAAGEPFEVVDPAGHWVGQELACAETGSVEVVGYDGGAAEWIDEPAAIRGILRGVLPGDRVMRPAYGLDRLNRWAIVRDGDVVGLVWFTAVTDASDPRGGGLGRVDGDVCADAGIGGTVPPRDPDEDGVELDCRAQSQAAFEYEGTLVGLPEGESFITANVQGIRSTDDVVPPVGVDGSDGWGGVWTVVREGKTVASIDYPTLDGITCYWNAIGIDP